MRIFKRKGSPNWWVTWSDQGGRLNRRGFGTTEKQLAETQAAQSVKMKNAVAWGIFCVSVVIGVLLGLLGTGYAIFVGSHPGSASGFAYSFLGASWIFGAFIGLIGWEIKRTLTKTDRD